MMAVARNVAEGCSSLKAGKWERSKFTGIELKGKTLAIVGAGKGKHLVIDEACSRLRFNQSV
jgi:D-3-phosphoglycerate dehydrogenase